MVSLIGCVENLEKGHISKNKPGKPGKIHKLQFKISLMIL